MRRREIGWVRRLFTRTTRLDTPAARRPPPCVGRGPKKPEGDRFFTPLPRSPWGCMLLNVTKPYRTDMVV